LGFFRPSTLKIKRKFEKREGQFLGRKKKGNEDWIWISLVGGDAGGD